MGGKKNEFGEVLKLCPSEEKHVEKKKKKKLFNGASLVRIYVCACAHACVFMSEELSISLSWCLRGGQRPLSVSAVHLARDWHIVVIYCIHQPSWLWSCGGFSCLHLPPRSRRFGITDVTSPPVFYRV